MKKTALLLTLTMFSTFGCEKPDDEGGSEEGARSAIPTAESLSIEMPSGASAKPAIGDPSWAYLITLGTAVSLNGSVGVFLGIVRLIVAFPVTSIDGDTYIWGPWHDEGKPGEYQLAVTYENGKYHWTLQGRLYGEAGQFKAVVTGVADGNRGGSFGMDFEFAKTIDPASEGEGTLDVSYDGAGPARSLTIDAEKTVNGVVNAFHYEYEHHADGSGALRFMAFGDTDDPGTAEETVQFDSRWRLSGAGRADAQISGGDLGSTTVNATECWNEWPLFRRVYWNDSALWSPTQGLISSCAIQ